VWAAHGLPSAYPPLPLPDGPPSQLLPPPPPRLRPSRRDTERDRLGRELSLDWPHPLSPLAGTAWPLIHRPPSALAVPSSAGWRPHRAAAPLNVKLRGDNAGVGACPGRSTGILRQDVDSFYAKVLTLCTKVLTQGCFDRIVSASRGESPRNSLAASSSLVGVDLVNVSTSSRKVPSTRLQTPPPRRVQPARRRAILPVAAGDARRGTRVADAPLPYHQRRPPAPRGHHRPPLSATRRCSCCPTWC